MTGANGILSVPSEHLPGLIALVAFPLLAWLAVCGVGWLAHRGVGWAVAIDRRVRSLSAPAQIALGAIAVGAIVHAALVPTHWGDERLTATLFILDTVGFIVVAAWMVAGWRFWRAASVLMLGGTAAVYAYYILNGSESADAVGLLTTTVELAAALVLLVPATVAVSTGRQRWTIATAVPVALFSLVGTAAIANVSSADAVDAAPANANAHATSSSGHGMAGMSNASGTATLSLATTSPAGPITWPDSMPSMMPGMEMVTPNCTAAPTAAQQKAAVDLVNQTAVAVAPYESLAAAKAAGYVPITPTGQKVVHYINYSIARRRSTLDPSAVPVLVYVNTQHGAVLSAAMYLSLGASAASPPQPGGCLTQWHLHNDLCFSGAKVVGNEQQGACAAGEVNATTKPMMHVWMAPVAGGPLAPDPGAVAEVVAAAQIPPLAAPNGVA